MAQSPLRRVVSAIRRQVDPDASGPDADERLLARFAVNGDRNAFELLVWRHGSMVLGTCRRILGDHHLAEDAFQATFLALARKPRAVRSGASLAGWLHRVARRIAAKVRVDNAKRHKRNQTVARSELVSPSDVLSIEAQAVIDEEIDRLPEKLRRAVVLCYLDGHTADQAARMLGCPLGTVLSRLAAARERLRVRLTRRGFGASLVGLTAGMATAELPAATVVATTSVVFSGAASTQLIGWANGALYAMVLNKIKLATATILTVSMFGAGVGWVTVPGREIGGPASAQAANDQPPDENAKLRELLTNLRRELEDQRSLIDQLKNNAQEERRARVQEANQLKKRLAEAQDTIDRLQRENKDAAKSSNSDDRKEQVDAPKPVAVAHVLITRLAPREHQDGDVDIMFYEDYLSTQAVLIRSPAITTRAASSKRLQNLSAASGLDGTAIRHAIKVERGTIGIKDSLTITASGVTPEVGVAILDAVIDSYQEFFQQNYKLPETGERFKGGYAIAVLAKPTAIKK